MLPKAEEEQGLPAVLKTVFQEVDTVVLSWLNGELSSFDEPIVHVASRIGRDIL